MKLGKLHIHEAKIPEEIELINELLATVYSMRVQLRLNHTQTEEKAWKYLKEKGYENK